MQIGTFSSGLKRLGAAAIVVALGASGAAAQFGEVGDVYVVGGADIMGFGFNSPVVMQYDGATGERVGNFAQVLGAGQFMGMTWAPNGNMFTTHMNRIGTWDVREFDGDTGEELGVRVTYGEGDFSVGKGLAFGPYGDLYVGDWAKGTVSRYDGTTYDLKTSTAPGGIGTPNGMRFTPDGNLLVVSGGFNELREFNVDNNIMTDLGSFATGLGGIQPQDMTYGPDGNIFVSLGARSGVVEIDGTTGDIVGDFIPRNTDTPNNGLAFDNHGRLLVSDIFPLSRVDSYDAITGAYLGEFIGQGVGGMAVPTLISIKPIPAPASLALLMAGGVVGARRRRR